MSTFKKTIVPASPGYFAIDFERRGERVHAQQLPVIAWTIELGLRDTCDVQPICIYDLSDLYEGAVLATDGRVAIRSHEWWETLDEYLSYFTSCHGIDWQNLVDCKRGFSNDKQ